jgi:predicted  nucleic acid-binding Zn-ribbon protein
MSESGNRARAGVARVGLMVGLLAGCSAVAFAAAADMAQPGAGPIAPIGAGEIRLAQAAQPTTATTVATPSTAVETPELPAATAPAPTTPPATTATTAAKPSMRDLNSAASELNEALAGAREKLDELRQATELAAMAAELRDELEASIQENNRLAAALAESQSERERLEGSARETDRRILELTQTVEASQVQIANLSEQLTETREEVQTANAARAKAEAQVLDTENRLSISEHDIAALRAEITALKGQLSTTETELTEANDLAIKAREDQDSANRELNKVRKQIAGMLRSVLLGGQPIEEVAIEEEVPPEVAAMDLEQATGRYETLRASNIRSLPSADADRVGFARRGEFVSVTGKVTGRNWFQVETETGIKGFIFGDLIRPAA